MKKALKVFGILFLVLLVAAITLPFLFKDQIKAAINEEIQNNINAEVDFKDLDLGIIQSFPNFYASLQGFSITGKDTFQDITLFAANEIYLNIDLMSVLNSSNYKINQVKIDKPVLNILVLQDSTANYDIFTYESTTEEQTSEASEHSKFDLKLKNFEIENAYVTYDDRSSNTYFKTTDLDYKLKADVLNSGDQMNMTHTLNLDSTYVALDKIAYLNWAEIGYEMQMLADLVNQKYTFKENLLSINKLNASIDGFVHLVNDTETALDLNFNTSKATFKDLLSLVPAIYKHDYEQVKADGNFSLAANIKGTYSETDLPGFNLELTVDQGRIQYPDLPSDIHDIKIDAHVNNPSGNPDHTIVKVNEFHALIANNPIEAKLLTKTPISDPYIDAHIKGKLDLDNIQDFIPLNEGEQLSGIIQTDLDVTGNVSSLENEQYDSFEAKGFVEMNHFSYKDQTTPLTKINDARLVFSPKALNLERFDMQTGNSDFQATGNLYNYLPYYLHEQTLKGDLTLNSNKIDLNEWMQDDPNSTSTTETTDTTSLQVIEVPQNIDFNTQAKVGTILYENKVLSNASGILDIKDGILNFKDFRSDLLDGTLRMNGVYNTQNIAHPFYDFNMQIERFDLPLTYKAFEMVQSLAPIVEKSVGKYSTNFSVQGALDHQMNPDMASLNSKGKINTHNVRLENTGVFSKLAAQLKMDKFKTLDLNNVNISYEIKDGNVHIKPFNCNFAGTQSEISGTCSIDQKLDFVAKVDIPSEMLASVGSGLVSMLGGLSGGLPQRLSADVLIGGTVDNPSVKLDLSSIKTSGKQVVQDKINNLKDQGKQALNNQVDKAKEQAKAKADQLIQQAEKQAHTIKDQAKKAADLVRQQANQQADQLVSNAKNPIAKIAAEKAAKQAKIKADQKANKIEAEAAKKADQVIQKAKNEAARLN